MNTLNWKIRYALEVRRLLRLSPVMCWQSAGAALENVNGDTRKCPVEAAQEERDEWAACCG